MAESYLQLWDDYECNGGSIVVPVLFISDGRHVRQLDGRDQLQIRIYRDQWYNDPITSTQEIIPGRVIRVKDALQAITEWRISQITDSPNQPYVTITADPVLFDLGNLMTHRTTSGSWTDYNLGGALTTPEGYITQYVIPAAEEAGWDWLGVGVISNTDTYDLAWPDMTALELLRELESVTMTELWLERVEDLGYDIYLGTRGASATVVRCEMNRNIVQVQRIQEINQIVTVCLPLGKKVQGAIQEAQIAHNAWKVTAIDTDTPSTGTDRLTVVDPSDSSKGPVLVDDQLNGYYIIQPDATTEAITDSALSGSTHYLYVADSSALSVSDHVQIVADSVGTYLTTLEHPTNVLDTSAGGYGRRLARPRNADYRGERNLIPNPLTTTWTSGNLPDNWTVSGSLTTRQYERVDDAETTLVGTLDGAHSSDTTVDVTGFPASSVIQAGCALQVGALSTRVEEPVTLDGSGAGTITVAVGVSGSNGAAVTVYRPDFDGRGGGSNAIAIKPNGTSKYLVSPSITVKSPTTGDTLWATCSLSNMNTQAADLTWSADTITVEMRDSTPSTLASVTGPDEDITLVTHESSDLTLRVAYALTANKTVTVRMQPNLIGNYSVFCRWMGLHLGPDPEMPVIEGSHANRLWHLANTTISNSITTRYDLTLQDLASLNCYSEDETLTLGGTIRVIDDVLGIDIQARIVALQVDLLDPLNTLVRLATNPTRVLSKVRNPRFAPRTERPDPLELVDNLDGDGNSDGTETGAVRTIAGREPAAISSSVLGVLT